MTASAIKCMQCDYDLRKASCDGLCPECGLSTVHSAAFWSTLAAAPRGWLLTTMIGNCMVLVSILPAPIMPFRKNLSFLLLWRWRIPYETAQFAFDLLPLAMMVLLVGGVWLTTRSDGTGDGSTRRWAWAARCISLVLPALPIIGHQIRAAPGRRIGGAEVYGLWMSYGIHLYLVLGGIVAALLALLLRRVSLRVRAEALAANFRTLQWAWVIVPGGLALLALVERSLNDVGIRDKRLDFVLTVIAISLLLSIVWIGIRGAATLIRLTLRLHLLRRIQLNSSGRA